MAAHPIKRWAGVAKDLLTNPVHTRWMAPLILLADALLCLLIVWKIPYTEIDWKTYMQQVSLFLSGERDYTLIKGDTGPLVYPAAHVYIYSLLYHCTDKGQDIDGGQVIFAGLYLVALALVLSCYRRAGAPPYLLPLLVLSKRLHSIFLLRLFNDGIATLFLWASIYLLQRRLWLPAVVLWSLGVGVKMTVLLVAPALGVILLINTGLQEAMNLGFVALLVQLLLATPFISVSPLGYISKAFEFTREFMFKWTVNWRFLGEELFLSKRFAVSLLVVHASLLIIFATHQWLRPTNLSFTQLTTKLLKGSKQPGKTGASSTATIMLSSLTTGLLCARTLHYQFFAYIAWSTPLLLWSSGLHPVAIYVIWALQEWAWNTFPSTPISSAIVVACLAVQSLASLASTTDKDKGERKDSRRLKSS